MSLPPQGARCTAPVCFQGNTTGRKTCGRFATWTKPDGQHRCSKHNIGRAAVQAKERDEFLAKQKS